MPAILKPMLAGKVEDVQLLRYPALVSRKLDGIRCVIRDGVACSRNGKRPCYTSTRCCGRGVLLAGGPLMEGIMSDSRVIRAKGTAGRCLRHVTALPRVKVSHDSVLATNQDVRCSPASSEHGGRRRSRVS
jgi:hypothetical protein